MTVEFNRNKINVDIQIIILVDNQLDAQFFYNYSVLVAIRRTATNTE
jgi:hypothetical protein